MEKLQYALLDIITSQNSELAKFRTDNYWYDQCKVLREENKKLREEICVIYKDMQALCKGIFNESCKSEDT